MKKRINFVKGHMGGDEIILLDGRDVPLQIRKKIALSVLHSPNIRGREVGILYKNEHENNLSVKIVELTSRDYIPMCGGLTQVVGKALIETNFRDLFDIKVTKPNTRIYLHTDAGVFPINVEVENGKVGKIFTDMETYVKRCKLQGFNDIKKGVRTTKTGICNYIFTAIEYKDLTNLYPNINFWKLTPQAIDKLDDIRLKLKERYLYTIIYEKREENLFRTAFRFLPPDPLTMEEEFACGTGSTALSLILYHKKLINIETNEATVEFILKEERESTQPETTSIKLRIRNKEISNVRFSHSHVEIISEGRLFM